MQQWYCMPYFKSHVFLRVIRKLILCAFEFICEEEIDSEADFARKRIIGEFSR